MVICFPLYILVVSQLDSLSIFWRVTIIIYNGEQVHVGYLIGVFIQSFNKHSLYFYYVPSTMADTEDTIGVVDIILKRLGNGS